MKEYFSQKKSDPRPKGSKVSGHRGRPLKEGEYLVGRIGISVRFFNVLIYLEPGDVCFDSQKVKKF